MFLKIFRDLFNLQKMLIKNHFSESVIKNTFQNPGFSADSGCEDRSDREMILK